MGIPQPPPEPPRARSTGDDGSSPPSSASDASSRASRAFPITRYPRPSESPLTTKRKRVYPFFLGSAEYRLLLKAIDVSIDEPWLESEKRQEILRDADMEIFNTNSPGRYDSSDLMSPRYAHGIDSQPDDGVISAFIFELSRQGRCESPTEIRAVGLVLEPGDEAARRKTDLLNAEEKARVWKQVASFMPKKGEVPSHALDANGEVTHRG